MQDVPRGTIAARAFHEQIPSPGAFDDGFARGPDTHMFHVERPAPLKEYKCGEKSSFAAVWKRKCTPLK